MYYKISMFSPLVGEATAKATGSLQVSPSFAEFFINVSKAHSGRGSRHTKDQIISARVSHGCVLSPSPQKAMSFP